jgi:hypothetical protein
MSPRKRTVDDLDDTDDQDGIVQDDREQDADLKLHLVDADEADLGGTGAGKEDDTDQEADNDATGHRG